MTGAHFDKFKQGGTATRLLKISLLVALFSCTTARSNVENFADTTKVGSPTLFIDQSSGEEANESHEAQVIKNNPVHWSRKGIDRRRLRVQASELDGLLETYAYRHKRCLFDSTYIGQYVVVSMEDSYAGLGNRMLSVVTGMLVALLTQRCFFLRHDTYHREFKNANGLDMHWLDHEAALERWGRHNITSVVLGPRSLWTMSPTDPSYITDNLSQLWEMQDVIDIHHDNDYLVSLLLSNPNYCNFFDQYFPSREIFHPLSRFLFNLHDLHENEAQTFRSANFAPFTIGIQIRMQKSIALGLPVPEISRFCTLAGAIQLKHGLRDDQVRFFLATDSMDALEVVSSILGAGRVVSLHLRHGQHANRTTSGNPGTEDSAVLDMRLLSMTDALIITSASSFGYVAAAWGGIIPIHVLLHGDKPSILNPYFFVPFDTEPCYWGAHRYFLKEAPKAALDLFKQNPMWMQYAHCG